MHVVVEALLRNGFDTILPMSMAKGVMPDDHPLSAAAARGLVLKNADVVMLLGARLNWLLAHGKGQKWNPDARFIQLDIEPEEIDSNRPIAAPVVGDIASSMEALLAGLTAYPMTQQNDWLEEIDRVKQVNAAKMEAKLNANPSPMDFFSALKAIRTVLEKHREVYLVNEGANTLDDTRNVINMYSPRKTAGLRYVGRNGSRHGLCHRSGGDQRSAGGLHRRRQRVRVQRDGNRDHLPLSVAGDYRHPEQRRYLQRFACQPGWWNRPFTDDLNAVYITNGTPRTIKLGNRSITFKKGTPRYFAYQSRVFTMVVTALKEIGDDKVSDEVLLKIKTILDTEEKEKVNHDYKIAPQWIRKKLKTVLYGNN